MHETSIAGNIIDIINESVNSPDRLKVNQVKLKIGMLSNVNIEALVSAFQLAVMDSELSNTKLIVETQPVILECNDCKNICNTEEFIFSCVNCGSNNIEVKSGDELEISEIILDR